MAHRLVLVAGLLTAGGAVRTPRRRESSQADGDACTLCLESAEGVGCDQACVGKSVECQSCVHWDEKASCSDLCDHGSIDGADVDGSMSTDDTHKPKEEIIDVASLATAGDDCTSCLQWGGGASCAGRCTGKSQDCQECVRWGGGAGCISRCSGGGGGGGPINWNDWNAKVSTYFTVGEVCQWDTRRIPRTTTIQNEILAIAAELDKVRAAWGSGIIVNSWYRPPDVNREIGGATNSQHIYGRAVDIRPSNGSLTTLQSWLDNGMWSNRALGYGAACCGFVHIDLRQGRIRWNYR